MTSTKIASLVAGALLCACASGPAIDITKPVTGEAATNAARAYQQGLAEKKGSNYLEATRYLEWVRNNFPYSQYAALSELALADMAFERDEFAEAATKYQDFVKSHPSHPKADYASFRAGLARYRDKPSDWFLLPPAHEKDQQPIREAVEALQRFTLSYPKSEFVPEAKKLIADCRERLAQHERYVADFYWKRGSWKGAANRLLGLADAYGDLNGGRERSENLWRAAIAFRNAGDGAKERATLERLIQETGPRDPHYDEARRRIAQLPQSAASAPGKQPNPGKSDAAPITPTEVPSAPSARPEAAPGPGRAPSDQPQPQAPPAGPMPGRPTTQEPPPAGEPTSQPPTPPLGHPGK